MVTQTGKIFSIFNILLIYLQGNVHNDNRKDPTRNMEEDGYTQGL